MWSNKTNNLRITISVPCIYRFIQNSSLNIRSDPKFLKGLQHHAVVNRELYQHFACEIPLQNVSI
jgi:hypothetical protein